MSSRALKYWLERSPRMAMAPPGKPWLPSMVMGGQPVGQSTPTPTWPRPSTRS